MKTLTARELIKAIKKASGNNPDAPIYFSHNQNECPFHCVEKVEDKNSNQSIKLIVK